jgi:tetratricopeptide (TPR) repeat protein
LPLALSHAAAYCESGTSFAEYLKLFETYLVQRLFAQSLTAASEKAVATTWLLSMQAARDACALAEPVLAMAAYMAPDDIPKVLFDVLVDRELGDRLELTTAFLELRRLSLASVDDTTISVHRVLQKTVRDEATSRDDQTAATIALEALVAAFPDTTSPADPWWDCAALAPHVMTIAEHLPESIGDPSLVVSMLRRSCRYLQDSGERKLAVRATARAAEIAARLCDEDDDAVALARTRHAAALQWDGQSVDALELSERIVAECEARWGDEEATTLTAKAQLAFSYQWARRIEEAVSLGEEVLRRRRDLLGDDHLDTLSSMVELSWSYWLAERFADGLRTIEPALAQHERRLGEEHPTTIFDRATIAVMHRELGRRTEAITGFEWVLRARKREFGEHHPDTLWTRANLAKALELDGDPRAAIATLRGRSTSDPGVVRKTEHVLGPCHQDSLCARAYLASALWARRATHEARALIEGVRTDLQQSGGPWLPRIVVTSQELRDILDPP